MTRLLRALLSASLLSILSGACVVEAGPEVDEPVTTPPEDDEDTRDTEESQDSDDPPTLSTRDNEVFLYVKRTETDAPSDVDYLYFDKDSVRLFCQVAKYENGDGEIYVVARDTPQATDANEAIAIWANIKKTGSTEWEFSSFEALNFKTRNHDHNGALLNGELTLSEFSLTTKPNGEIDLDFDIFATADGQRFQIDGIAACVDADMSPEAFDTY